MSWDDKDWYGLYFEGENIEILKEAWVEFGMIDLRYADILEDEIKYFHSGWNVYEFPCDKIQDLERISKKYSIRISYSYNGKWKVLTN